MFLVTTSSETRSRGFVSPLKTIEKQFCRVTSSSLPDPISKFDNPFLPLVIALKTSVPCPARTSEMSSKLMIPSFTPIQYVISYELILRNIWPEFA